jgi:hypothetical protein
MTMNRPGARVIGIKGDDDTPAGRHQDGVAHRARKSLPVDFDNLEFMTVQMHRMRHTGLVHEH